MGTMSSYVANIRSLSIWQCACTLDNAIRHALLVELISNLAHAVMMKNTILCCKERARGVYLQVKYWGLSPLQDTLTIPIHQWHPPVPFPRQDLRLGPLNAIWMTFLSLMTNLSFCHSFNLWKWMALGRGSNKDVAAVFWGSITFLPFSILLFTDTKVMFTITHVQTDNCLQESLQSGLRSIQITSDCHILQNFLYTNNS